jgi:hypothetical protein
VAQISRRKIINNKGMKIKQRQRKKVNENRRHVLTDCSTLNFLHHDEEDDDDGDGNHFENK